MHSKRMQTVQPESIFRFRCILIKQFHYWSQGGSCPTPGSKHASHDAMMLPKATWATKKNLRLTDYCCFNIRLRRWRWRTGWRSWTKWFWCWEGVSPAARSLAFACAWASPDHIWIVFLPSNFFSPNKDHWGLLMHPPAPRWFVHSARLSLHGSLSSSPSLSPARFAKLEESDNVAGVSVLPHRRINHILYWTKPPKKNK